MFCNTCGSDVSGDGLLRLLADLLDAKEKSLAGKIRKSVVRVVIPKRPIR
jgi:hypothetical protein